jgi:hypothetical protein
MAEAAPPMTLAIIKGDPHFKMLAGEKQLSHVEQSVSESLMR